MQLLFGYDTNRHITALSDSIRKSWNSDTCRDRAGAILSRFICHDPRGVIRVDMTLDLVTSTTFHCMVTPIQHLLPAAAEHEAGRILHNMCSLRAALDEQRTKDYAAERQRKDNIRREERSQREAERKAEERYEREQKARQDKLRADMELVRERRRAELQFDHDYMTRHGMWFPEPWPEDPPWDAGYEN